MGKPYKTAFSAFKVISLISFCIIEYLFETVECKKLPKKSKWFSKNTYHRKYIPHISGSWDLRVLVLGILNHLFKAVETRYNVMKWHICSWLCTKFDDFQKIAFYSDQWSSKNGN